MNRNDDFDQTLIAWLRREAPEAPDRVLDTALQRVAGQPQQRGWLQGFMGGDRLTTLNRVAAVAAVVAFAAFIGYQFSNRSPDVGASPSPSAEATPSPSAEATPSQTGLPSASASPSTGPPAALVFRLERRGLSGVEDLVIVLEDGRIITKSAGVSAVERRLAAAGIQLLRDELDATGLTFLASADYLPVFKPGVEPFGFDGDGAALEVGLPGGGTAMITWLLRGDLRDYLQPQPEAEALEAMLARLISLDDWLPANAWADANARPYAPRQYRILISSSPCPSGCRLPVVESSTVSWPLIEGIDAFGAAVQIVGQGQEPGDGTLLTRCRVVSAGEGAPLIEALESAGATFEGSSPVFPGGSFDLGYRATSRWVYIGIEPILPHADASCGVEITF